MKSQQKDLQKFTVVTYKTAQDTRDEERTPINGKNMLEQSLLVNHLLHHVVVTTTLYFDGGDVVDIWHILPCVLRPKSKCPEKVASKR